MERNYGLLLNKHLIIMSNKSRLLYSALAGLVLGVILSHCCRCGGRAEVDRVERDTVIVHDTVPDLAPVPKDSTLDRVVTRWLPAVLARGPQNTDNADNTGLLVPAVRATGPQYTDNTEAVAVEVPITSKHYQSQDYDAWVSGYEVSLDSIKVYKESKYITERVTLNKPPDKWELDAFAEIDYRSRLDRYTPCAGLELTFKPGRLQVGIRAGVSKMEKTEPVIGAVVRYRIF